MGEETPSESSVTVEPESRADQLRSYARIFEFRRRNETEGATKINLAVAEALEFQATYLDAIAKLSP
jgi:hypothetical protein